MAAVMGGTQSLHTNGYDEALSLPTERAARIALRTQQIIGYESGIADTPDPLAGSYFVETLTDEVERLAWEYIARIDEMGGAVEAIEAGFQQDEIEQAAYEYAKSHRRRRARHRRRQQVHASTTSPSPTCSRSTRCSSAARRERLAAFKADRDHGAGAGAGSTTCADAARGTQNLLYPMKEALRANATLGEVSDALRDVFGVYQPGR